ncbi:coiled-coil domain-containing protein 14 [Esox lucius]|uniref:Coiled-coil domain containing 14 n=1 Tax=Esox lucius TaxID=8010 RepID=A0A3P8ZBD1_ESOLU|nr:coiled-coil domain-containing protein 14 [Esox lucius]
MTKQGLTRHKVISSGRLTGGGRGQALKKRGAGRPLAASTEPAYSLYSTDSEDQVTTIHKGLDRCAALLGGILLAEKAEAKSSSVRGSWKTRAAKSRPLSTQGKERGETERRKQTKRQVAQAAKKPAPVQKTILSSQSCPGKSNIALTSAETSESDARFNCRLTTSTPTLSPQRLPTNSTQSTLAPGSTVPLSQPGGSISGVASPHLRAPTSTALLAVPGAVTTSLPPAPSTGPVLPLLASLPGGSVYGAGALAPQSKGAPFVEKLAVSGPAPSHSLAPVSSCSCSPPCQGTPVVFSERHTQPKPHLLADTQTQSVPDAPSVSGPSKASRLGHNQERSALAGRACSHGISGEEEEECPVRDTSTRTSLDKKTRSQLASTNPQAQADPEHVPADTHRTLAPGAKGCGPGGSARHVMTVRYVLGELKSLFVGRDVAVEHLLGELEKAVSLLPVMEGSSDIQAEVALVLQPLRSENALLRRRLRMLNQQLQGRERAEREARDLHCDTDVSALQSELSDAHAGLRELQQDNTELRQALVDTQRQLQHSEAECGRVGKEVQSALAEVQACNSRLEECQKENTALTLAVQLRETEIRTLQERLRALQVHVTQPPVVPDMSMSQPPLTKQALDQYQDKQGASDHLVSQYLRSLEQKGLGTDSPPCKGPGGKNTHQLDFGVRAPGGQNVCVSVGQDVSVCASQERKASPPLAISLKETVRSSLPVEGSQLPDGMPHGAGVSVQGQRSPRGHQSLDVALESFPEMKSLFSHPDQSNSLSSHGTRHLDLNQNSRRRLNMDVASLGKGQNSLLDSTDLSLCEVRSFASDWSAGSSSTFDTRDEQEFRNGLAALDASIASLQRTIKQDLKR